MARSDDNLRQALLETPSKTFCGGPEKVVQEYQYF